MPIPRSAAVVITLAFGLMMAVPPALGHSEQQVTHPEAGEQLDTTPDAITVEFDAPMRITSVTLKDGDGTAFPVEAASGRDAVTTLEVPLQPLPDAAYTFSWRGLSEDGHTMSGELSFSIEAR